LEEQRRIADFLDAETFRISIVERRMMQANALMAERSRAVIDYALSRFTSLGLVPISSVCSSILDCVNKTAPTVDYETPYKMIRTSNVRNGFVDTSDTYRVSEEIFNIWNRRGIPRRGDVLLTREAPLGQVGILDSDEPVFLGQRIVLYRANQRIIDSSLLLFNLLSSRSLEQFKNVGEGALHEHMRVGDALKLKIVCPPLEEQSALSSQIRADRSACFELEAKLDRQLALLAERRQALITAAVTGQIDVTTARGVEVP
jgi:type I restriction enzyme S subunit